MNPGLAHSPLGTYHLEALEESLKGLTLGDRRSSQKSYYLEP